MIVEITIKSMWKYLSFLTLPVGILLYWFIALRSFLVLDTVVTTHYSEVKTDRSGQLKGMIYEEGNLVKRGEILFSFCCAKEEEQLSHHRWRLEELGATLSLHLAAVESAMQEYLSQRTAADLGLAERKEADRCLMILQDQQEQVNLCKQQLTATQKLIEDLESQIKQQLIKAPVSGIVAKQNKHSGEWVQKDDVIYSLYDPKQIWLEGIIPEQFVGRISLGTPVQIEVGGIKTKGTISWISPIALPKQSGVPVRVLFEDLDSLSCVLPNLSAKVRIKMVS